MTVTEQGERGGDEEANDTVFVLAHRRLTDLSEKGVRESIEAVMALADDPVDGFATKYSGTTRRRAGVS